MNVVEPGIWRFKCADWCDGVPMDSSALALNIRASPFPDICVDPRSDIYSMM